jgi:hypothetical protein
MINLMIYLLLLIAEISVIFSNPASAYSNFPSDKLIYEDRVYNPNIKTVNLYVNKGYNGAWNEPAAINIRKPDRLILEFDELYEDARYFQAKIIHCNYDWTPSQLRSIEYIDTYNEFEITEYEYSVNSRILYTHYRFMVPGVSIPGNYLLVVYGRDDPDDLILSMRFIVYDQLIDITPVVKISSGISERRTKQQIEFTLNYGRVEVFNPQSDIKVVVRKNQSWVTAIYNLKPTQVRELQNYMEFEHFNLENNFYGGNEFRFFELNSIKAPGRNVDRVLINKDKVDAFLLRDKDRGKEFYSSWKDMNGGYFISTLEGSDPQIEAEYVNVHFFLQSDSKISDNIYVYGKLSHYNLLPDFKMKYEYELGGYLADILLKQGYYEYIYYTPDHPYIVEGSHFETENEYEILVYYKPQGKISEYLVGYIDFNSKN